MSVVDILAGCSAKQLEELRDGLRKSVAEQNAELAQVEDAIGLQMQKGLRGGSAKASTPASSTPEPSTKTATPKAGSKAKAPKATGGKKRGPKGKTQNLVLNTVNSADAPLQPKDILAAIKETGNGVSEGSIRNTIFRLAREEKLVKSGDEGGYVVADGVSIEA